MATPKTFSQNKAKHKTLLAMTTTNQSPVPQAPMARKRRNTYRHLATLDIPARTGAYPLPPTRMGGGLSYPFQTAPIHPSLRFCRPRTNLPTPRREGPLCPGFLVGCILWSMEFTNPRKCCTFASKFYNYENGRTNDY